jgi:methionine-rich copper-binding protein CopC/putative copper export protein
MAVALIAAALLLGGVGPAQAHAQFLRSEPADNSVLAVSPSVIKIWYSEPIASDFSSAQLLDVNGKQIQLSSLQYDASDRTLMVLTPPKLADGVYTVNWRAASASDGHATRGVLVFRVGAGSDAAAATSTAAASGDSQPLSIPETVVRWLNYFGLLAMLGAAAMPLLVMRSGDEVPGLAAFYRVAAKRSYTLGALAATFVFAVGLVYLVWQIGSLSAADTGAAPAGPLAGFNQMLFGTTWGDAWIARQMIAAVLILLFSALAWAASPSRLLKWLAVWLIAAALAAEALTSHAAGGPDPALPVLADWLHLVFAGLWVGGLFALSVSVLPLLRKETLEFKTVARATWGRFGPLAAVSVGMVIATGVYALGQRVISADALLLTEYGLLLAVKIGLVLLAGLVGLLNSLSLHPALSAPLARWLKKPVGWTPISLRRLPAMVLAEMGLGIGIALLVGALTTLPPAGDVQYTISPTAQPDSLTRQVDDLYIDLSIKPNRPGQNIITVLSSSSRRPAPAEVLRVIVRMTYLEQDFGTISADAQLTGLDTYRASLDALTQPGRWQIDVVVRRKGIPDSMASFNWTVLPLGNLPPVLVSRSPWRDALSLLAGLMLLGVLAACAVVYLGPRFPPRPRPAKGLASRIDRL